MALSREQLHRVIDHLSPEKLPALADLIEKLIDEDDEPLVVYKSQWAHVFRNECPVRNWT